MRRLLERYPWLRVLCVTLSLVVAATAAGCGAARAAHQHKANKAEAHKIITQAENTSAGQTVIAAAKTCFKVKDPTTKTGLGQMTLKVVQQQSAIRAHRSGTVVDCMGGKLNLSHTQRKAWVKCAENGATKVLETTKHNRVVTIMFKTAPDCYTKVTGGSGSTSAQPTGPPSPSPSSGS